MESIITNQCAKCENIFVNAGSLTKHIKEVHLRKYEEVRSHECQT
jgi:uncharacterized C2H2 Zn-finger protein